MADAFDPIGLALDGQVPPFPHRHRSPAFRRRGRFLRGPISMSWLERAAKLPGRALHVALAIRHQCNLEKSSTVALSNKHCAALGVDRDAKRRGLEAVQTAGLVIVERKPGRLPIVTIVEI
jgi:hypothetical protein